MKKFILATVSAIALFGVAACSDSGTDETTTQSVDPSVQEQPMTTPDPQAAPGTDGTIKPVEPAPLEPAPAAPAPAQ